MSSSLTNLTYLSDSFPPPTESESTQQISSFEIDDGRDDDVENGCNDNVNVKESFKEDFHSLPTPAEVTGKRDTDAAPKHSGSENGLSVFTVIGFMLLFMLGIVGIGVGLALGLQVNGDPMYQQSIQQNQQGTYAVISTPTVAPVSPKTPVETPASRQERYDSIKTYLIDQRVSSKSDLTRIFTGQFAALNWISGNDGAKYPVPTTASTKEEKDEFVARYVLAVIYYSTQGESWTNGLNFLSSNHICDWYELFASSQYNMFPRGVACNENKIPEAIFLDSNNLFGTIPFELSFIRSLTAINFDINTLTGPIPKLELLNRLQHISLAHNQLSGFFPEFVIVNAIGVIETVDLSYNYLSGTIPEGSTPFLTALAVDNNILEGSIAASFGGGKDNNYGFGPLNPNVEFLYLEENNFTDTLDDQFLIGLNKLRRLDLSDNDLDGTLPKHLFEYETLEVLDLHDNQIGGTLPSPVNTNLKFLALQNNKISSSIPTTIAKFSQMFHLDLSSNDITGEMPASFVSMTNLTYLFLAGNNYTPGPIPVFFSKLTDLVDLSLKNTKRYGTIPSEIGDNLRNLVLLDLDSNQLTGTIPTNFGNLQALQFLLLNNNKLTGNVPLELGSLEVLRLLFIDGNDVGGSFNNIFCNRPETQYKPYVIADCGTDDGAAAEVACNCCFKCCTDENPCNDEKIVPSNDPMWQFGYQRLFYTFGDRTVFFAL